MKTATNPETGEKVALIDGKWTPIPSESGLLGSLSYPVKGVRVNFPVPESVEAGAIGAGRGASRLSRGILDLYHRASGDKQAVQDLQSLEREDERIYRQLQAHFPVSTTLGEMSPYVLAPAARTVPGAMALSSAMGGLEHQDNMVDRAKMAGAAGAAGGIGHKTGQMAGRYLAGRINQLDDGAEALAQRAERLGFRLTPGQRTGNKSLVAKEAAMKSSPVSGDLIHEVGDHNQTVFHRIVGESLGMGNAVQRVDDQFLGEANDRISDQFRRALGGNDVNLDSRFANQLANIERRHRKSWVKSDKLKSVLKAAKKELNDSGGVISAERAQEISSELRKQSSAAFRGAQSDPALGRALQSLRESVDDAAVRSLSPEDAALLMDARQKYRILTAIEANVDPAQGVVSGKKLGNWLARNDKHGYLRGHDKSDLYDATRISRQFGEKIGDSGTATRMSPVRDAVTSMGRALSVGGGAYMLGMDPVVAASLGGAASILSPAISRVGSLAYMSPLAQKGVVTALDPAITQGLLGNVGRGTAIQGLLSSDAISGRPYAGGR